jgi:hypothetical protein
VRVKVDRSPAANPEEDRMRLEVEALDLETRYAFRIARGTRQKYRNFFFRLEWEGLEGWGEAAPQGY